MFTYAYSLSVYVMWVQCFMEVISSGESTECVTSDCEPPHMMLLTELESLGRIASTVNCWVSHLSHLAVNF